MKIFNDKLAEKIRVLRERWACSKNDAYTHCFWTADAPEHVGLSHEMIRVWAEALVGTSNRLPVIYSDCFAS